MTTKDNSFNIYNKFDPNFVNYGELYKSPREMKQNSKLLINHYADALVKGESPVYVDSPHLVGNRYFISTNSQCLDKNDNTKTHTRSILVDNVNTSAMETTKDNNTGLIYSLLASLKTINGDEMFQDISNNQPMEYLNNSTDYLNDISNAPMPVCSKITVFADDKKDKDVSGWITDKDRQDIDPKAIKEGFIDVSDSMSGDLHPDEWREAAERTNEQMQDQAEAVSEEAQRSADDAMSSANAAKDDGPKRSNNIKSSSGKSTQDEIGKQSATATKAFNEARRRGAKKMLEGDAEEYMKKHKDENIFFFIKEAINSTYNCKGEIHKVAEKKVTPSPPKISSEQQKLYDKYKIWHEMGIAENIIRDKMIKDGLDPKLVLDVKEPESKPEEKKSTENSDGSKTVRIPSKCLYTIFTDNPVGDVESEDNKRSDICDRNHGKISVKNVFNAISNLINKNKTNLATLEVPGIPNPTVCVWGWETVGVLHSLGIGTRKKVRKDVESYDYKKMMQLLERYRKRFAMEIVRYSNYDFYGACNVIENQEAFTTMKSKLVVTPYKSNNVINMGAYLFIIAMIFLIFYIVYKTMFRAFDFKSVLKKMKVMKK
tara:strand:- start:1127 stop:2926 length:1800 start_codon:yes stop_codon:yes gene_type:complete